jgi:hypothetical protein
MFRVPSPTPSMSASQTAVSASETKDATSASPSAFATASSPPDYNDMDLSEKVPASSLPAPAEDTKEPSPAVEAVEASVPAVPSVPAVTGKTARCQKGTRRNKKTGACEPAKSRRARKSPALVGQITRKKERSNAGRIRALENTQDEIIAKLHELEHR